MKRMTILSVLTVIVAFACGAVPTTAQTPQGVDLAQLKSWDIVVATDAIPSEKYAAEEFQKFFSQASGVKLPVVTTIDRPDKHIFIGPSQAFTASNVAFSIDDFGEEDLRIVVRDGNIAIAGGRPRGTLYGVYTFLENYLGVRFLTHDHTHVPSLGDTQVVGPINQFYQPPLKYRFANYGENLLHPAFAVKLRCNGVNKQYAERNYSFVPITEDPKFGEPTGLILINHTLHGYVPPEKYGQEHPEYYALVNGKRMVTDNQPQLCFTNPDVLKIVIQGVLNELEQFPHRKLVSVSQHDGRGYCRCAKCAAIDKREESHMGALLTLVNAVADEVAKTHPDVMVGTLAYVWSEKVPKNLKPRPNVQIQLCSVPVSPLYSIGDESCSQNEAFRRTLSDWSRICKNIGIWNYNLNHHHYLLPNPNMRVVEPNIRFFVANNVRSVFMQSPGGLATEFSDLKNYVASSLLWNPNQSGKKLRDEFLDLHYGPAAGPIRHYIDLLHDKARINTKSKPWVSFCGRTDNFGIDKEVIEAGLKAFETALELVKDDQVLLARVEKASICVYLAAITPAQHWGEDQGVGWNNQEYPKEPMPPEVARTRPYAKRLFELCKIYRVPTWGEGVPMENMHWVIKRTFGLKKDESL